MSAHDKNTAEAFGKRGLRVAVREGKNGMDKAIRTLKKRLADEGILKELRKREAYEKPGDRRRRRKNEAIRRYQKSQAQLLLERGY